MKNKNHSFIFPLCICLIFIHCSPLLAEDLTPEQLIQLMEASAKQYFSMDAKLKATFYQKDEGNAQPAYHRISEITSRWTQDRKYWRISSTGYSGDKLMAPEIGKEIKTYSVHRKWTKYLTEVPDRVPRGVIRSGGADDTDQTFYTIYLALWDRCEEIWKDGVSLYDVNSNHDDANDLYILRVQVNSPEGSIFKLWIDPAKGFIPIRRDTYHGGTGKLLRRVECNQFEKINGVWIPRKFSWNSPYLGWSEQYTVEQVHVNTPIDEKLFDFAFPKGTIVRDEIAGLKYRIEDMPPLSEDTTSGQGSYAIEKNENGTNGSTLFTGEDLESPRLPKEETLLESAAKTEQIIAESKNRSKYSKTFCTIVVSLFIILITIIMSIRYRMKKRI